MSSVNNKEARTKSDRNASYTDLPDTKTNSSTTKTAVHRQGKVDESIHDN